MKDDLQRKFTISSHTLVCFSIGYFLYDAVDMVINHRKRSTYELLLHHGLVILCYSVAVISRQFVAFVALSLIVEVNSVFLHARQLFIITSQPKGSLRYKANALLNVVTFLFFRLILLAYMTCWLASQRSTISFGFLAVGFVGLGVIVSGLTYIVVINVVNSICNIVQDIMNIILFCRILYTDMEVFLFQCSKLPDTISVEKVTLLEAELDEHSISKILSSEEKEEEEEDSSNIQSNSFNTNNQNFVNGCQKRKEWSPENLVRD